MPRGRPGGKIPAAMPFIPYRPERLPEEEMLRRAREHYEELDRLAHAHAPKMIMVGASAYPRQIDFARIARIAAQTGRSPHAVMVEALEREVARTERVREFVREALASDAAVEAGAAVYPAKEVHAWLERLAKGEKPARPPPRSGTRWKRSRVIR